MCVLLHGTPCLRNSNLMAAVLSIWLLIPRSITFLTLGSVGIFLLLLFLLFTNCLLLFIIRYLLAVDEVKSQVPSQWSKHLQSLQRNSSSTLEAFLIPSDDPRTRQVFSTVSAAAIAKRAKGILLIIMNKREGSFLLIFICALFVIY